MGIFNPLARFTIETDDKGDLKTLRLNYLNQAWEQILEISKEKILGKTIKQFWPEAASELTAACRQAVRKGETEEIRLFSESVNRWFRCRIFIPFENSDILSIVLQESLKSGKERKNEL